MIDSALALPLYHQVAGILRQRIEEGVYPAGVRLSSEDELAVEFDVSRATVRQAMGDRTRPNVTGVHFYDEPGLTWEKNESTGEFTRMLSAPASERSSPSGTKCTSCAGPYCVSSGAS